LIPDTVIATLCRQYRNEPFFENHAGSKTLTKYFRKEHGFYVNHKKLARILKENHLLLSRKIKKKVPWRVVAFNRTITAPNQLWEFDIKYGYVVGEQRFFFVLAIVDVYSRKCVGKYVGRSCKAGDLTFTLTQAIDNSGADPRTLILRSDNGPQMTSKQFHEALKKIEKDLEHEFIPPATPNKNAHVESFFSLLERELLVNRYYVTFADAYQEVHDWIAFYNERRLHGSLGDRTPNEILQLFNQGQETQVKAVNL
jgi:putative transposase